MAGIFEQGGPQFGVEDAKIFAWASDGDYSGVTLIDIPSVQRVGITIRMQSAELEGDDGITAVTSKAIGVNVTIRNGSFAPTVWGVLFGKTPLTYDVSSRYMSIGIDKTNYIGLIARSDAAEGESDTHIFVPKLRVMEDVEVGFEYNNFTIPELSLSGVKDDNFTDAGGKGQFVYFIDHATATQIVGLPPEATAT